MGLHLPLAECKRDNLENSSWKGAVLVADIHAGITLVRDTFAINYSRIMLGCERAALFCCTGTLSRKGEGKEILRVGSFFRRCAFSSGPRPSHSPPPPRYSAGGTILCAEICGFIGNSYEERFARVRRGNWINFVRSSGIHVQSRCDSSRGACNI